MSLKLILTDSTSGTWTINGETVAVDVRTDYPELNCIGALRDAIRAWVTAKALGPDAFMRISAYDPTSLERFRPTDDYGYQLCQFTVRGTEISILYSR